MAAPRKFIVTIRAETELDVYDIQEAVVDADSQSEEDERINIRDVDVELVELTTSVPRSGQAVLRYNVLEVA